MDFITFLAALAVGWIIGTLVGEGVVWLMKNARRKN